MVQELTRRFALTLLLVPIIVSAACQKGERADTARPASSAPTQPPQTAATPAPTAGMPSTPMGPGNVIASAQYSADPDLRCDLLEAKRVSGGALLVRWRIINTAGGQQAGSLTAAQPKQIHYDFGWQELYYIDPAENKKYAYLTDSEGNKILDVFWGELPAAQQRANWAKFPAPPPSSTKISIYIPKFPPFEDVPVS